MKTDLHNSITSHFIECNVMVLIMHHSVIRASAPLVAAIAVSTLSAMQYRVLSSTYIPILVFF